MVGAGALLTAAFTYAIFGVLARTMSEMWGDSAQVAARFSVALPILVAYFALRRKPIHIPADKRKRIVLLGLTFVLTIVFFTISVQHTTLANSVLATYSASIVSAFLIGTVLLKEKVTGMRLFAIALSLMGLAFMHTNSSP